MRQHPEEKKEDNVRAYRPGKLTILQLMGALAMAGVLAYFLLNWLFG